MIRRLVLSFALLVLTVATTASATGSAVAATVDDFEVGSSIVMDDGALHTGSVTAVHGAVASFHQGVAPTTVTITVQGGVPLGVAAHGEEPFTWHLIACTVAGGTATCPLDVDSHDTQNWTVVVGATVPGTLTVTADTDVASSSDPEFHQTVSRSVDGDACTIVDASLVLGAVATTVVGTEDNDVICAFGGAWTVAENEDDDLPLVAYHPDTVQGLGGDDSVLVDGLFSGASGGDAIDLGAGTDTLVSRLGASVATSVGLGTTGWFRATSGSDRLRTTTAAVERYVGGPGSDRVRGSDADEYIDGGRGNDEIVGGGGSDTMVGGGGIDVVGAALTGGSLIDLTQDTVYSWGVTESVVGFEGAIGTTGNDTLVGDAAGNVFLVTPGHDEVAGRGGTDRLSWERMAGTAGARIDASQHVGTKGAARTSFVTVEAVFGSPAGDVYLGSSGVDVFHGGMGNDVINGFGGADLLYGDAGTDRIRGGLDADRLFGGFGRDVLVGGLGRDLCTQDTRSRAVAC